MDDAAKLSALAAYAEMMNTLNVEKLIPFLSTDLRYNSQWVFEEMVGSKNYIEYIRAKLESLKGNKENSVFAEIGKLHEYPFGPCVIMAQGERDNLVATVLAKVDEDGLITALDMCSVLSPKGAKRTGEYPGKM